jgi:NAD(P)-dependent dehydrogenase (short-subunit alcohol dehydrogenase family)
MTISLSYPAGGMLVTGGTGNVGAGVVRRLAAAGVPLVFTYRTNATQAEAVLAQVAGASVVAQPMDMTDAGSIRAALDRVVEEYGAIHGVACGAGQPVPFDRMADFSIEQIEAFMHNDAIGYYRIFHEAVPMLRANGGGTITTTTSVACRRILPYDGISAFSKAAVDALIRQVATEEGRNNIRCNAVAIGWVEPREMEQVHAQTPAETPDPQNHDEMLVAIMQQQIRQNRLRGPTKPDEAGNLFAFLASDQASYLTGQSISLDGGFLL